MQPTGKAIRPHFKAVLFLSPLLFGFASFTSTAIAQAAGTFTATGGMTTARTGHTATLLNNGKVLIAGGWGVWLTGSERPPVLASAELYDPDTGSFTRTGDMTTARSNHAAILLPNGKVLIAGGTARPLTDGGLAAELYDPSTGTFTPTGDMGAATSCATATLLDNGKVFVAGGVAVPPPYAVQLYDPATATFTAAGTYASFTPDNDFGGCPTTTLLTNGKVLVTRPFPNDTELYDPSTGTFTSRGETMATAGGTMTLLKDGRVLAAGGIYGDDVRPSLRAALYDPASGAVISTSDMAWGREYGHTATLLPEGKVLVAGGDSFSSSTNHGCSFIGSLNTAELYDPSTSIFANTSDMTAYRSGHTATLLNNGQVLITGGTCPACVQATSAELYVPSPLILPLVVTDLRFDVTTVAAGTSYSVKVSGSNLTAQTLFDVRFSPPGSNTYIVALNWQRGVVASHDVPAGTTLGKWTLTGIRAHEDEADHNGSFSPLSAAITVSP
jgi:hypothetical protein